MDAGLSQREMGKRLKIAASYIAYLEKWETVAKRTRERIPA